jgi:hypothetical protein
VSAQPGLFLGAAGAALSADFIAADVEQDRIAHIRALPLAPFQFGAFEGKRRVASFGWPTTTASTSSNKPKKFLLGSRRSAPRSRASQRFPTRPSGRCCSPNTRRASASAGIAKAALRARLRTVGRLGLQIPFRRKAGGWERFTLEAQPCSLYMMGGIPAMCGSTASLRSMRYAIR